MSAAGQPEENREIGVGQAGNRFAEENSYVTGKDHGHSTTTSTCCPSPTEEMRDNPVNVGVLGATGVVGQHFVALLHGHPWFRIVAVSGSARTAGLKYGEAVKWHLEDQTPLTAIRDMEILACDAELFRARGCALVFSALAADVAGKLEKDFAEAGIWVFSNARSWRSASCVPILLPLVNSGHLDLVLTQESYKEAGGGIVTNANCASTGLAVALAPILRTWGIERVVVATLQACSGAGYPGESAVDMIDNVVPYISGEEEKLAWEPQKILGKLQYSDSESDPTSDAKELPRDSAVSSSVETPWPDKTKILSSSKGKIRVEPATFESYAMCHRVPVTVGHTMSVILDLPTGAFPSAACTLCVADAVEDVIQRYKPPTEVQYLPSCPQQALLVLDDASRPQPRLDRMQGAGMSVSTGPVKAFYSRQRQTWTLKFTLLVHNTVLGAAGCSILNAELALVRRLLQRNYKGGSLQPFQSMKITSNFSVFHSVFSKPTVVKTTQEPPQAKKKHCQTHIKGVPRVTLAPSKESAREHDL